MPNYIYVSGTTFYLLAELPEDGDYVHASYTACHREYFGHVGGDPCANAPGGSYAPVFREPGLFKRVY